MPFTGHDVMLLVDTAAHVVLIELNNIKHQDFSLNTRDNCL